MDGKPEAHTAGAGPAPVGSITAMAMRLAAHARQLGLKCVRISRSKVRYSKSTYLKVRDDLDNTWVLRMSDHPATGRYDFPHFDLLTRDGVSGEQWLADSLAIIAGGGKAWFDIAGSGTPLRQPPLPKKRPSKAAWKRKDGERK